MLIWLFSLPSPLFRDPISTVLEDRDGGLLGAKIAADGQWRFPRSSEVPERFATALCIFEDRRFYVHPGVDFLSLARALWQNIRAGRVVSGGSTLTMQVIRLSRKGKSRTVFEKLIEIWMATRLELTHSKKEILSLYASHAPFGGNVVGLDAASWRYFGMKPESLSWAEAAALAVLPNSPALIHPGRNREALLKKRNRLLDRLLYFGKIDSLSCQLAKEELLPLQPHPLPRLASHLLERAIYESNSSFSLSANRIRTTVRSSLQTKVNTVIQRHLATLKPNEINNLAVLVLDVESGEVLAYAGNAVGTGEAHGEDVDVITAPRSTGSVLKPFLYAMMLNEGQLLPGSLVSDIPVNFGGYMPENFRDTYDGVIPVNKAVIRSLNVPLVRLLQDYGLEKFHFGLQKIGLTTLKRPPGHYGLTLILGGAEGTLWDITGAYASLARTLRHYPQHSGAYRLDDFRPPNYLLLDTNRNEQPSRWIKDPPVLSAASIWFAFEAMKELERPNEQGEWEVFRSSKRIAWKTGTSYGFRDAWAVGVTPRYAVGVWVGNADGEGRPGLIGILTAAPVLFEVFDLLPTSAWFAAPYDEMIRIPVCQNSGFRASAICTVDTAWVPLPGLRSPACSYHQIVHLDQSGRWQVHSNCELPASMMHVPWFVLPPVEEFYYKNKNPRYRTLPPFRQDCGISATSNPMQLIYPRQATQIFVPVDLDGKPGKTVFKVAHRDAEAVIHWHLDQNYLGTTRHFHHFELNPPPGMHRLTLVDEKGNRLEQKFEIIGKEN